MYVLPESIKYMLLNTYVYITMHTHISILYYFKYAINSLTCITCFPYALVIRNKFLEGIELENTSSNAWGYSWLCTQDSVLALLIHGAED